MKLQESPPFAGDRRSPEYIKYIHEKNKESALNMRLADTRRSYRLNKDNTISTEKFVTLESDGKHYVVPSMFEDEKGNLVELTDPKQILDKAKELGQYYEFDNADDADYVSRNIKTVAPVSLEERTIPRIPSPEATVVTPETVTQLNQEETVDIETTATETATTPPVTATETVEHVENKPTTELTEEQKLALKQKEEELGRIKKQQEDLLKLYTDKHQRDQELLDRTQRQSNTKTMFDILMNTGQLIGSMFSKQKQLPTPDLVEKPNIPSAVDMQRSHLNRNIGGAIAMGRRMSTEMGRPELMTGSVANMINARLEGEGKIAEGELNRIAQQAQMGSQIDAQNTQTLNQFALADEQMKMQEDLIRREERAKIFSNFSHIFAEYIKNNYMFDDEKSANDARLDMIKHNIPIEAVNELLESLKARPTIQFDTTADKKEKVTSKTDDKKN